MNDRINYYLYKSNQFPTLPTIYTTLMQVMSNPRSTIKDIADVIIKDQSSVIKILRVVNSPLYGLQGKIDSINQAILFLGFNEVKSILLSLSIMEIYSKIKNSDKFNVVELWKHSLAVGIIAKKIAEKLKIQDTENFFIAGLIHDVGKLFFVHFFDEDFAKALEMAQQKKIPLMYAEMEIFGTDHCKIGSELAKKWYLPNQLRNVIEYHHRGKIDSKTDTMLSCIHLADIISQLMDLANSGEAIIAQPSFEIWNIINFNTGCFKSMYDDIISGVEQSNSVLQIK